MLPTRFIGIPTSLMLFTIMDDNYLDLVRQWAEEFERMRHVFTQEEIDAMDSEFHAIYLATEEELL